MASAIHLDKEDGFAPINRRISIIVLNDEETKQILREYDGAKPINDVLNKPQKPMQETAVGVVAAVKIP